MCPTFPHPPFFFFFLQLKGKNAQTYFICTNKGNKHTDKWIIWGLQPSECQGKRKGDSFSLFFFIIISRFSSAQKRKSIQQPQSNSINTHRETIPPLEWPGRFFSEKKKRGGKKKKLNQKTAPTKRFFFLTKHPHIWNKQDKGRRQQKNNSH